MVNFSKLSNFLLLFFLLLLPTQLGKHFFLDFSFIDGVRVDYLAPTLYLTDILAIGLIILNWKAILSMVKTRIFLVFLLLALINTTFALSPFIALYKWVKIFEIVSLFVVARRSRISAKAILTAFLTGAAVEFVLAAWQFSEKHAIQGAFYYLGERYLNLQTPDIAKAALNGREILRPYGTFSHPNSMAGFYLLAYFYFLIDRRYNPYYIARAVFLLLATLLVFISFSKVAIATFLLLNILYLFTFSTVDCRLCKFGRTFILLFLSAAFFLPQGDPESASKRWVLLGSAVVIFSERIISGVGLGNYVIAQNAFPITQAYFFLQPVHNIFLLVFAETGLLIGIPIFGTLIRGFKRMEKPAGWLFVLLPVFITGMVDHYWLTLQQNMLLLPIILAFLRPYQALKKNVKKK